MQPERTPVHESLPLEKTWVRSETLTVMGIDPGWAKMGIVVLRQTLGGPVVPVVVKFCKTEKDKTAKAKHLRVSIDDGRRLKEIWDYIAGIMQEVGGVNSIAAEVYAPFRAQGGNAWKSAMAYAMVHGVGSATNTLVQPFIPQDLKRAFGLTMSASKDEIGAAVFAKVPGLKEMVLKNVKATGNHEHVTDAAAHAYLGLIEIYRIRKMAGVSL